MVNNEKVTNLFASTLRLLDHVKKMELDANRFEEKEYVHKMRSSDFLPPDLSEQEINFVGTTLQLMLEDVSVKIRREQYIGSLVVSHYLVFQNIVDYE